MMLLMIILPIVKNPASDSTKILFGAFNIRVKPGSVANSYLSQSIQNIKLNALGSSRG